MWPGPACSSPRFSAAPGTLLFLSCKRRSLGEETRKGRSAKWVGAARGWEGSSEPRGFHHANGRVGFISAYTGAPGQAGNAWFPEAGPLPRQLSFLFLILRHLGEFSAVPSPQDPRNVLFCTALDAAPGPCIETSLCKSTSCHRWPRRAPGAGRTLNAQPPLRSECPTPNEGCPGKVKKCACRRYLFQGRSTKLHLHARPFPCSVGHPDPQPVPH